MKDIADMHGRCACGSARLRFKGMIVAMTECWCLDCQKETGGGATHSVITQSDALTVEGDLGEFRRRSDRGAMVVQRFCRTCANILTADVEDVAFSGVRVGLFEDRAFFRPQMVLFSTSAPAWATFPSGAQRFDTQPAAAA